MQEYLDYFNKSQNTDIQYISKFIKSKAIDKGIPVLICGSTGTGKEIVARLLGISPRVLNYKVQSLRRLGHLVW